MLVPKVFLPNVGFQLGIGTDFESTLGRVPRFVEVCWHCHCPACLISLVSCALNALSGPNPYISPGPTVHITLSRTYSRTDCSWHGQEQQPEQLRRLFRHVQSRAF